MTGIISEVYLYKGSEVDNDMAYYLIDVIYKEKSLELINIEKRFLGKEKKKKRIDLRRTFNL